MNNISTLLKLFLKLDYRDRDSKSFKKVIGIIFSYLIAGIGLSINYFLSFDYLSCIILIFSFNSFLILFLILNDYPNLFFSKSNIELLNSLPFSFSEFIISKIISAFIYISFFSVIITIPQTILYIIIYKKPFFYFLAFFFQNVFFTLFFSFIILIIYSSVIKFFSDKASIFIYIIQAFFILMIMASTSFTSKESYQEKFSILQYSFVKYLPQYYFSLAVDNIFYFILSFIFTSVIAFLFYLLIKRNFEDIFYKLTSLKRESRLRSYKIFPIFNKFEYFVEKIFLRNPDEQAGFYIAKKVITGSRLMLLKFIPLIIMPLILVIIGLITENNSLLFISNENTYINILSPTISLLTIMMFRISTNSLKFSDEISENINWIYDSLPFSNPKLVFNGCYKYIYSYFIIPVIILIIILLSIKMNLETVLLNIFFILPFATLLNKVSLSRIKVFPFTLEVSKFNTFSRMAEVFISLFWGFIAFLLQLLIFKNITYIFISIIFILILNIFINYLILNYVTGARKIRFRSTSN